MNSSRRHSSAPDTCPQCGADVPAGAAACPECGSCAETGWSEQARYDALDLPDEAFDYDEFTRREFGGGRRVGGRWRWLVWLGVGLLAAAVLLGIAM
ncbi:MAG TPA: zinc ribbon domain-containing protein [Verrucomicrobiota bacterium]|nr:zinc ribbon domain-containing protein [Verrucomicrobiota bacterium]HNU51920.1 zinc ribbon domain-containing protein [Verrucomicrobiota bacterium]